MSIYLIESIAFKRLVEGNRQEARAHARKLDQEYQPAFGTTCRRIGREGAEELGLGVKDVSVSFYPEGRRNG